MASTFFLALFTENSSGGTSPAIRSDGQYRLGRVKTAASASVTGSGSGSASARSAW